MKKFLFLPLIFLLLLVTSCNLYKDVEVSEVKDLRMTEIGKDGMEAEIEVDIYNPNFYNVKLVKSDVDLFLNGKPVGKVTLSEKVVIKKKTEQRYTIIVNSDLEGLSTSFFETLISALLFRKVHVKADGDLRAKALFIGRDVGIEVDQQVELSR
jgi:LEA14-like dessication related protein